MRNSLVLMASISFGVACSSSTTTQSSGQGESGAQNSGGGSTAKTGPTTVGGANHSAGTTGNSATSSIGGAQSSPAIGGSSGTPGSGAGGVAVGVAGSTSDPRPTGGSIAIGGSVGAGSSVVTGGTLAGGTVAAGGVIATGGLNAAGSKVNTGGSTGTSCTGQTKLCNGSCIPVASCCGGCSGTTPVCSNGTCVGRPNGDSCSSASECASNVCADGVCCDVGCDGQCEACNLATSKGTCSPSTSARANNPCTTDGSICGGACDGTAAHRKSCVYAANTTLCGPGASCNTSTNQSSTAQLCNGSGLCKSPEVKSCAPYRCNGTACGTSCPTNQGVCSGSCVDIMSDPGHCGGACQQCSTLSPRCYSGACVQCTVASDCTSLGYGQGSICTSNHTCQCRQPSSANKILNPGFDSSLQDWTPSTCTGCTSPPVAFESAYDVDGCPASGSVLLTYYSLASGSVTQCVPVQPNTYYNFGFAFKQEGTIANAVNCTVEDFAGSTCSGNTVDNFPGLVSGTAPAAGTWSSASTSFTTGSTVGSVSINCGHYNYSKAWMDHIYLNASGSFF